MAEPKKKRYAFEAAGRWTQVHYVEASSAKEAKALFDVFGTIDCADFCVVHTSVRRRPDCDED